MDDILIEDGEAKLTLNGKFYDLRAILKAAKEFENDFYVLVDGDPLDIILVTLKPKKNQNPENGANEFLNLAITEMKELI